MRTLIIAAVAAGTTLCAIPAAAQTTGAPFTGLRIEGVAGYDALKDGHDTSDGVVYGGGVGYDVRLNNLVVGAEGELTGSTTDTRTSNLVNQGDRFRVGMGRDVYLGARVGVPLNPTTLAYAKGGYTNARIDTRYTSGTTEVRDHTDLDGFRLGAGLEHQMGSNTYIKGEYRYSNYGRANGSVGSYDIDADRHQIVAGVGMRF
ncbi:MULTISPECIES: outer membrane protein [unclassified Sphingomonas]|jgi:outer membrane immunogenic protein|uniref:outer membrane protein n=1 Tax=unclassified Sphingomonas TaxID=196159 RepID=UPI000E105458|nr:MULTISPECIES: outer membrane beta-barrel protein [unclassified Sphingomonas]AXJ95418.1 porin family protein [Sphingomonas sp. FARSPH]